MLFSGHDGHVIIALHVKWNRSILRESRCFWRQFQEALTRVPARIAAALDNHERRAFQAQSHFATPAAQLCEIAHVWAAFVRTRHMLNRLDRPVYSVKVFGYSDGQEGCKHMSNGAETRTRRSQEKILGAAEAAFLEHGYLGTRMDAVAELAGVSKQTVYSNFGSKEALFLRVVHEMTGGAAETLSENDHSVEFPGSVADYFYSASVAQLSVVMTSRLMRLRRMVIGEVERFPELGRELHRSGPKPSIDKFSRAIRHYQAAGALRAGDPMKTAKHYNWLLMGELVNSAMLLGDDGLPTTNEMAKHAKECVDLFLSAYANRNR